mgnify:CR=1 FL=1
MKRTKKKLALCAGLAALLVVLVVGWNCWFSSTKVAFINYQTKVSHPLISAI